MTTCVFHVSLDGGDIRVGLNDEEFNRIRTPSELKRHIDDAKKYLDAGGQPKYEPIISRVVARALIENELVDVDTATSLIQHQASDRYLLQILNLIGGGGEEDTTKSEFRKSLTDVSSTASNESKESVTKELSKYLTVLQGGTPSLDPELKEQVHRQTGGREKRVRAAIQFLNQDG